MRKAIKKFLGKPFLKSIIILSGGSLLAQIINFIGSTIMTREYSKEEIGHYMYILSLVTIFSTVVNGRYDVSIVSAEDEKETFSLIKGSFYLAILTSILITIGSYIFCEFEIKSIGKNKLILFTFPILLMYGIINILNGFNNRYAEYKLISTSYFIRTTFQNIFTIILGIFFPNAFSLLLSQSIGLCFGMRKQSEKILKKLELIRQISFKEICQVLKKYKLQLLVSVPASFINALSYSSISLFIGNIFGMNTLALYSISVRVLGIPLGIFSTNIAKVHFKAASDEIKKKGNYKNSTIKMILFSMALSLIMVIILICFAPFLFSAIFGKTWLESGEYVRILAPMFGLRLIVGAVGFSFIISNKQNLELLFQILLFIVMFGITILSNMFNWQIKQFLIVLSICYSLIYLLEIVEIIICSRKGR